VSAPLHARSTGVEIAIRVQPGARRTEPAGLYGDEVKIRVAAPPANGRANDALIAFLADQIGVSPRRVRIISGQSSRSKRVMVEGTHLDSVRAALGLA